MWPKSDFKKMKTTRTQFKKIQTFFLPLKIKTLSKYEQHFQDTEKY